MAPLTLRNPIPITNTPQLCQCVTIANELEHFQHHILLGVYLISLTNLIEDWAFKAMWSLEGVVDVEGQSFRKSQGKAAERKKRPYLGIGVRERKKHGSGTANIYNCGCKFDQMGC